LLPSDCAKGYLVSGDTPSAGSGQAQTSIAIRRDTFLWSCGFCAKRSVGGKGSGQTDAPVMRPGGTIRLVRWLDVKVLSETGELDDSDGAVGLSGGGTPLEDGLAYVETVVYADVHQDDGPLNRSAQQ